MQQNILFILDLGWLAGWSLALRPHALFYKRERILAALRPHASFYKREIVLAALRPPVSFYKRERTGIARSPHLFHALQFVNHVCH